MENLKNELLEAQVGKVLENEPLANHTTMKIGGPADLLIVPKDIDSVKTIMDQIKTPRGLDGYWKRVKFTRT